MAKRKRRDIIVGLKEDIAQQKKALTPADAQFNDDLLEEAVQEIERLRECLKQATALLQDATPHVWIRSGDNAAAHAWKAKVADLLIPDLP